MLEERQALSPGSPVQSTVLGYRHGQGVGPPISVQFRCGLQGAHPLEITHSSEERSTSLLSPGLGPNQLSVKKMRQPYPKKWWGKEEASLLN